MNAVSGVEGLGGFVDVSIEQIIAWDPDVIWFPQYSDYTAEDLLNDPAWSSISAVQNNRVHQFPSRLELGISQPPQWRLALTGHFTPYIPICTVLKI